MADLTVGQRLARALSPYVSAAAVLAGLAGAYVLVQEHLRADAEPEHHQLDPQPMPAAAERGPYAAEYDSAVERFAREVERCRHVTGGVPFVPFTYHRDTEDVVLCIGGRREGSLSHPIRKDPTP